LYGQNGIDRVKFPSEVYWISWFYFCGQVWDEVPELLYQIIESG
jgi:hypothetical protein